MENKLKSCPFCGCKEVKLTYIKGKTPRKIFMYGVLGVVLKDLLDFH